MLQTHWTLPLRGRVRPLPLEGRLLPLYTVSCSLPLHCRDQCWCGAVVCALLDTHIRVVLLTLVFWGRGIRPEQQLLDQALDTEEEEEEEEAEAWWSFSHPNRTFLHNSCVLFSISFWSSRNIIWCSQDVIRGWLVAETWLVWSWRACGSESRLHTKQKA